MKDVDDEITALLLYQYKNASKLWERVSLTILKAMVEIRTWEQLCEFWGASWAKLEDFHQQATLYWEVAEEDFWKLNVGIEVMKGRFKEYESIKKYREEAMKADRRAGEVLNVFERMFNLLKRNRVISSKQLKKLQRNNG